MEKLYKGCVKTSETNYKDVIVTVQRNGYDTNGNAVYRLQVWIDEDNNGHLWSPIVKGYRKNKKDEYRMVSADIDKDVTRFIEEFEKTVRNN